MPPALCPSSRLVDQSFPRDLEDLRTVAAALGEIGVGLKQGEWVLVIPDVFVDYLDSFDWDKCEQYQLLRDIYNLLLRWFTRGSAQVLIVDCTREPRDYSHPVPLGSDASSAAVELWSGQVGKLLSLHEAAAFDKPFIGVACDKGFAGELCGAYEPPGQRAFRLVDQSGARNLSDAFHWVTDSDINRRSPTVAQVEKSVSIWGGLVENPNGGSHYRVTFPNGDRPYVLDRNDDPQPDRYLKEICPLVGLPFDVVKHTLLNGTMPGRRFNLWEWLV